MKPVLYFALVDARYVVGPFADHASTRDWIATSGVNATVVEIIDPEEFAPGTVKLGERASGTVATDEDGSAVVEGE